MKDICILGSTGSIGTQALTVCEALGMPVVGLAARKNVSLLSAQALKFGVKKVCIFEKEKYSELKSLLSNTNIEILVGMEGLCELASMNCDIVLNSVVGMIGLMPTLAAIHAKRTVALANKETLVTGGKLVTQAAKENGVAILPVDSEHSAIFQCLQGNARSQVKKIILTASGGPFFGKTANELKKVTVEQALCHPNWRMGAKVTIDSATLMNKGLELMEACWLFDTVPSSVEIVVHRESVIHSMVEYQDNAVIAQMGVPDMKLPIQYALTYPNRQKECVKELNFSDYGSLTFAKPDEETFRCLPACREAMRRGDLYPTIVNGANEQAVSLFLDHKISFLQIGELVSASLQLDGKNKSFTVSDIEESDRMAREYVLSRV